MPRPAVLDYTTDNCSLVRAMQVLGERWTLVVLREVFIGVCRFEDIRQHTGIPRQVLTDRLGNLVEAGLLAREPYQDPGSRVRHQYRLTPKGLDLKPALIALTRWGDRHLADEAGPPIEFRHRDCGGSVDVVPVCSAGHTLPDPRQTVLEIGPGARPAPDA